MVEQKLKNLVIFVLRWLSFAGPRSHSLLHYVLYNIHMGVVVIVVYN